MEHRDINIAELLSYIPASGCSYSEWVSIGMALKDEGCDCSSGDYFHAAHPDTDWAVCLEHAEKIGIGTRAYELIKI